MYDSNQSVEDVLEAIPRKDGVPDIGEMPFDAELIPYIVALVSQKKLRAVFLQESPAERSLREDFCRIASEKDYWGMLIPKSGILADHRFEVSVAPEQRTFRFPTLGREEVPSELVDVMKQQAGILASCFSSFGHTDAMLFVGDDKHGGPQPMHIDSDIIMVHQTLDGPRGMSYMVDPITPEIERIAHNQLKFKKFLAENPELTDVIPTGTITIFNSKFYHASSPQRQIAVSSGLGSDCVPITYHPNLKWD